MYSRSQHRPSRPVQIPEHYSGCAFSPSSEEVASPTPIEAAVTQESSVAAISAVPPPPPSPPCDPPTAPPLFHGLFGGRGATLPFSRGLQFDELFTDDLYMKIGKHAIGLAMKIKKAFLNKGYKAYIDSYTNQQFFVLSNEKLGELLEKVVVDNWGPLDDEHSLIRITTGWATTEEAVDYLISLI